MDVIRRENVNVVNAVIAGDLTETDQYLEAWLLRLVVSVVILSFTDSSAMKALKPLHPVTMLWQGGRGPAESRERVGRLAVSK